MKVKSSNRSSIRTQKAIKNAFVELIQEKKGLQYITVTELVKRADITRSSFYTHYDNIYEVAKDFQEDTMQLFFPEGITFNTLDDAYGYIDKLIYTIKDNEQTYKMLLSSNDPLIFLERIRDYCIKIIYSVLKDKNSSDTLKLDIEFFVDGLISQFLKYFRYNDYCSLEDLSKSMKIWIKKIFF